MGLVIKAQKDLRGVAQPSTCNSAVYILLFLKKRPAVKLDPFGRFLHIPVVMKVSI